MHSSRQTTFWLTALVLSPVFALACGQETSPPEDDETDTPIPSSPSPTTPSPTPFTGSAPVGDAGSMTPVDAAPDGSGSGTFGSKCEEDADCGGGVCVAVLFRGKLCTQKCDLFRPDAGAPCPANSTCQLFGGVCSIP